MKKIFAALILSAMVMVSFTACSQGNDGSPLNSIKESISGTESSKPNTSEVSEVSETSVKEGTSSKSSSNKQYATLDEFVKSNEAKKVIESTQETAGDMMDFELLAEGENLVYQFKYTDMVDIDASNFSNYLSAYESTYKSSAKYIASIVDVSDPHIVLRYLNADNTLIYEAEFDQNGSINEVNSNSPESSEESSSLTSSPTVAGDKYDTMDDFVNSEFANQIVESTQKTAGDIMDFELVSENDTKLVYMYTYNDQVDIDPEYFSDYLSDYEDTYISTVKYLKQLVTFDNPTVALSYVNADGSLIYSAEFDENGLVKETKG